MIGSICKLKQSSTGYGIIVGEDHSSPHPTPSYSKWDYIFAEYDPIKPSWRGEEFRLTEKEYEEMEILILDRTQDGTIRDT